MNLVFEVRGIPGAQGSKRHVGNGILIESSKKVKPWRQDVKTAAEAALIASDIWELGYRGPVVIELDFHFAHPRSHFLTSGNGLRRNVPPYPGRGKGDADKLQRSTFDALKEAGVIADDSQIHAGSFSLEWGPVSGARIELWAR